MGGTRETRAGAGVLAVAASEKGEKPVQKTRRGFLGTVAGLLGGTILVSAPEFARAQELAFVTYNVNSNERAKGDLSVQELERREMEEGDAGMSNFSIQSALFSLSVHLPSKSQISLRQMH